VVPHTVLIAAFDRLAALQQQSDFTGAEAFADTDALKALEAIARERPRMVVLEKSFATTARGTALVNRIKADPALAACEIRILETDGGHPRAVPRPPESRGAGATAIAVAAPPAPPVQQDTRRVPRVAITKEIEVLIDGNPAILVNISVAGAQVTSPLALRPNQRVRMSLEEAERPVRFNGVVAWASFEMPKDGPRYRAGISFYDASPDMVTRFIETITT
jgi:hypothetical protein